MRTFENTAAQGEISIRRIGDAPATTTKAGFSPLALENGMAIIGHSETGHHHTMRDPGNVSVLVMDRPPEGMRILHMIVSSPTPLIHLRDHDTHEAIEVAPGEYEIRIGREFDPFEEIARSQID